MVTVTIAVFVISLIAAALAALLVVSERYIANYGQCTIDVNDKEKSFTLQGGDSLLTALIDQKIFIPSACGGKGTCGYCKVKVLEGAGPLLPTEEPFLEPQEKNDNIRLSCQIKVRNDLRVEIPPELLAVKEYACVCADITDLTHDIKQFRFELRDPPTIDFKPGQYVQLLTPIYPGNDEEVYRAYSMSSDPQDNGAIELVIRLVPNGICTTWCFKHLQVGDDVRINGPYGEFHLRDTEAPILFIAGGSGIAPIKCILHHMAHTQNPRTATFFFGANLVKELCLTDRMHQFEKELPDFTFIPVVARPEPDSDWSGETGLVTESLARNIEDVSQHEAYLCGSPGMIDATIKVLIERGMTEEKIYYDKFA